MNLEQKKIIKIASKEAEKNGFNLKNLKIVIANKNWREIWPRILKVNPHLNDPTQGRNFTVVYYRPKKLQLGGDLWVLVDNASGEVILTLPGK